MFILEKKIVGTDLRIDHFN